ncbi:MAG: hypothetical protein AB7F86_15905 [Bdellovibrionales bacterium]
MPYIALILLAAVVLSPALSGGILYWDDVVNITNNTPLLSQNWWAIWSESYYGLYIPVTYTVWSFVYSIWSDPMAFHILNVVLHGLCAGVLYALTRTVWPDSKRVVAWVAALAFLLHPLQVEPVAWISGGRDLLSAFFGLTAILILARSNATRDLLIATVVFSLGLLCKALIAPLPFALLVFQRFRLGLTKKKWIFIIIWENAAFAALVINQKVQFANTEVMLKRLPLPERILTALDTAGFYLRKLVWPWPQMADYGRIPEVVINEGLFWGSLIPLGIFAAVIAHGIWRKKWPELEGWAFAAIAVSPVLGIVHFMAQSQSTTADRYMYVPLAGVALALGHFAGRSRIALFAICPVLLAWAIADFNRAAVWKDNLSFFSDMIEKNPQSFPGHTTIGVVFFQKGQPDKAIEHFKIAHAIRPDMVSPVSNLAAMYWETRQLDKIFHEIEPFLRSREFIEKNRNQKGSLSRMARVLGRAYYYADRKHEAHRTLCFAKQLDDTIPEGGMELMSIEATLGLKCGEKIETL